MAAVAVKEGAQFDASKIFSHVVSYLPSYARPRFIRLQVTSHDDKPLHWTLAAFIHLQVADDVYFTFPLECCGGDGDFQAAEGAVGEGRF